MRYRAKYKHYNIDTVKDSLTVDEICDNLGLRHRFAKGKHECQCPNPEHNDENFGNCIVKPYGCYCFACGKSFDKIDMVKEHEGVSFKEALGIMAAWGGVSADTQSVNAVRKTFPLSEEEVRLIGLIPETKVILDIRGKEAWCPNENGKKRMRDTDGDLFVFSNQSFSLRKLFMEDEPTFYSIVIGKTKEKLRVCNTLLADCSAPAFCDELVKIRKQLTLIYYRLMKAA